MELNSCKLIDEEAFLGRSFSRKMIGRSFSKAAFGKAASCEELETKLTDRRVDCGQKAAQTGRIGDERQRRGEIGELSG